MGDATSVLVAVDLTLLGDDGPNEGEEGFASSFGSVAPEFLLQVLFAGPVAAVIGEEKILFRAGENFLPAETVGDEEEDVFGFERRRRLLRVRGSDEN